MSETGCLYRATSVRGHTRKGMEERLVRRPCGSHPSLRERLVEVTLGRVRFDESSALLSQKHIHAIYRARLGRRVTTPTGPALSTRTILSAGP